MKIIKVHYQGVFHGPKAGPLNPSGFKFRPGTKQTVIVSRSGGKWNAYGETGATYPLNPEPDHATMMLKVQTNFTEQLESWRVWGYVEGIKNPPELLKPGTYNQNADGSISYMEADDMTHVSTPGAACSNGTSKASCGRTVKIVRFVSLHADNVPTCSDCCKVYTEKLKDRPAHQAHQSERIQKGR